MPSKYLILMETRARREFLDLPKEAVLSVAEVVDNLAVDPRPPGSKKLTAQDGYRIRRGKYRILYTIDDKSRTVKIYRVGHRREVYR